MAHLTDRRSVLKGLGAVAAVLVAVPRSAEAATALATKPAARATGAAGAARAVRQVRSLVPGTRLGACRLVQLLPVERGALPFELEDASGTRFIVEAHRHDPSKPGIARAGSADVFLVNGGSGSTPTNETHGVAAMVLAAILAEQEAAGKQLPQLATIVERWASDPPPNAR